MNNKFILIVCHARTGGTWVGKLFDTCYNVKYIWEPDKVRFRPGDSLYDWDIQNENKLIKKMLEYTPHVEINPEFNKGTINTFVLKLMTILPEINPHGFSSGNINHHMIKYLIKRYNPIVLHLVRHPLRWAASINRWFARDINTMQQSLEYYTEKNMEFYDDYHEYNKYQIIIHDELILNSNKIIKMIEYCDLKQSDQLIKYLRNCHKKDSKKSPHLHSTSMTINTLLNRWKSDEIAKGVERYVNDRILPRWGSVFRKIK